MVVLLWYSAANAVQAKDVVISEIMWGLDEATFGTRAGKQWIELYNTTLTTSATDSTSATVNMAGWILYFVDTHDKILKPEKAKVGEIADVANVVSLDW